MGSVSQERSGWRDEGLSRRHREWGFDCPCVDIDFLVLEYDSGKPKAMIEYKHEYAKVALTRHPSYKAIINLCDKAFLPFFGVRYKDDFSEYFVVPLNKYAREKLEHRIKYSENDFITFLYMLRGRGKP